MTNAIIFILFILLALIICFIISAFNSVKDPLLRSPIAGSTGQIRSNIGGASNNLEKNNAGAMRDRRDAKHIVDPTMQVRSRTNSIEFDRHGKFNQLEEAKHRRAKVEFVRTEMTYTISGGANGGDGLDYSILRNLLKEQEKYGFFFEERPIKEKVNISFGVYNMKDTQQKNQKFNMFDPGFFTQQAAIKNSLNGQNSFIRCTELYKTIKNLIPLGIQYIPTTYSIKEFETAIHGSDNLEINSANPLIFKREFSYKQQGVKIITNKDDYNKEKQEVAKLWRHTNIVANNAAIISEYIKNPMTVDGKKFHLRVHFLLSVINGITRCVAHNELHIITAREKYKESDWLNENIHFSGGQYIDIRYTWPDDIDTPDKKTLVKNMNACIEVVCLALAMSNITNFEETNAGYYIYGADLMIDTNFKAYIIELNQNSGFGAPGFGFRENEKAAEFTKRFSHSMFSFILNNAIFPYFGIGRLKNLPEGEFINNGVLSPFGNILTGKNKCILIPYHSAYEEEIEKAKQFTFYNAIHFNHIIQQCAHIDIFLIGICTTLSHMGDTTLSHMGDTTLSHMGDTIIGYIGLSHGDDHKDNKLFLQIAIIEGYQNRGIATAMIAQVIEIKLRRQIKLTR